MCVSHGLCRGCYYFFFLRISFPRKPPTHLQPPFHDRSYEWVFFLRPRELRAITIILRRTERHDSPVFAVRYDLRIAILRVVHTGTNFMRFRPVTLEQVGRRGNDVYENIDDGIKTARFYEPRGGPIG